VSASLSRGMLSSFGLSGRCFVQLDVLSEAVGCRRLASKWIERGGAEQVAEVLAAPSEGIDALKDPGLRRVRRLAVVSDAIGGGGVPLAVVPGASVELDK